MEKKGQYSLSRRFQFLSFMMLWGKICFRFQESSRFEATAFWECPREEREVATLKKPFHLLSPSSFYASRSQMDFHILCKVKRAGWMESSHLAGSWSGSYILSYLFLSYVMYLLSHLSYILYLISKCKLTRACWMESSALLYHNCMFLVKFLTSQVIITPQVLLLEQEKWRMHPLHNCLTFASLTNQFCRRWVTSRYLSETSSKWERRDYHLDLVKLIFEAQFNCFLSLRLSFSAQRFCPLDVKWGNEYAEVKFDEIC